MEGDKRPFSKKLLTRVIRNPKARAGLLIFILGYILALAGISYSGSLSNLDTYTIVFRIIPIVVSMAGLGYFLIGYLEGRNPEKTDQHTSNSAFDNIEVIRNEFRRYQNELRHAQERNRNEFQETLELIRRETNKKNELHLDDDQRKEIFESLQQSFSENINEEFFQRLNENISIEITEDKRRQLDIILTDFQRIKARLGNEIDKLSRKANLNLVIGSITTIAALVALWLIVFQNGTDFEDFTDMLYHYIPRLSLIVFIEVFAYFFLRLYKLNLNDMKYFQNELTTVELKLSSLTTAINFGTDKDISAITQELSKTERNFILQKGETTVDLEKSKLENEDIKEILKSFLSVVNKK